MSQPPLSMVRKHSRGFWETVKTVVYAVLIALGIRTFAYEPFNIPSGSMIPTLLVGDYLFVSKFSYGYSHHSLPFSLPLFSGRIFGEEPERGDVAVFKLPRDNKTDYIKRIVGLPGDRIQMLGGRLYVNGLELPRRPVRPGEARMPEGWQTEFIETLPNGVSHHILEMSDDGALDNTPEFVVPPGHYFTMGDNRDNSLDSRVPAALGNGVGSVPVENLIGRAEFIFFSHNGDARFWEVWKWPLAIRWGRFFQPVD